MKESCTLSTTASPEQVWKIWTDVSRWKDWDEGLKDAHLLGEFHARTDGTLVPDKGPKARFRIISVDPGFSYTFRTSLPFATMYVRRFLGYNNRKTTMTQEVWFEGPLSSLWWQVMGKRYSELLPRVMQKLRTLAERNVAQPTYSL